MVRVQADLGCIGWRIPLVVFLQQRMEGVQSFVVLGKWVC